MEKVSIIIVSYDSPEFLEKTIKTLFLNTDYPDFEVIVSNNSINSPFAKRVENLLATLCTEFINLRVINNRKNLYHGKGCMAGLEIAKAPNLICLCNDDIFIPASQSNWLYRLVEFLEGHPNAVTVTPSLYSAKETVYWVGKQDPKQSMHDYLHFPRGDKRIPTEPLKTCYNNMAVCLTKRYLMEQFPLGENCPHYGSDSEYANRIVDQLQEAEHWVLPSVRLYHYNIFNKRSNYKKDEVVDG